MAKKKKKADKTIKILLDKGNVIYVTNVPKGVQVEIEDAESQSFGTFGEGNNNVLGVGLT